MNKQQSAFPDEIRYEKSEAKLYINFSDGKQFKFSAEYLRVFSPSAEVQGHGPESAVLQVGKKEVTITGIESVGNYAIILKFDDGHDTGIYSWSWLYYLGKNQEKNWAQYLTNLKQQGGKRMASKVDKI